MRNTVIALILGIVAATSYQNSSLLASDVAETPRPGRQSLAWIRFQDHEETETYAGLPYLWLGKVNIELEIDVKPQPGCLLEILLGSKDDKRESIVTINGRELVLTVSGYDGFRWLSVPIPAELSGTNYKVEFRGGFQKTGFISEVRLTAEGTSAGAPDLTQTASKITCATSPPVAPEAFPEMRAIWDNEPPGPATPLADADQEAAFRKAERNARAANEQLYRCRRFVDGWLNQADPTTGLIPRNLTRDRHIWNAKDSAADNYPFMVLTCDTKAIYAGDELQDGIPLQLTPGVELRLIVTRQPR